MSDAIGRFVARIGKDIEFAKNHGTPVEPDEEFEPAVQALVQAAAHGTQTAVRWILARCESPAERLFAVALVRSAQLDGSGDWFGDIQQQVPIGRFRADFVLRFRFSDQQPWFWAAIEIDGHDFHEKTKEQASRDKRKDRALQAAGYIVLRFSGSDVYRDALACANEVRDILSNKAYDDMTDRDLH